MMTSKPIFAPGYWPFFKSGSRIFNYYAENSTQLLSTSTFIYDAATDSMQYINFVNGLWNNTWFYQYRPGFGLAEWKDTYPNGGVVNFITSIGWGEWTSIGATYHNTPIRNPFTSWPISLAIIGDQVVTFEQLLDTYDVLGVTYSNVLVFQCQQKFGNTTSGVRYWMAQGVGPVAMQFNRDGGAWTGLYLATVSNSSAIA